jgi:hypothetical protein
MNIYKIQQFENSIEEELKDYDSYFIIRNNKFGKIILNGPKYINFSRLLICILISNYRYG